MSIDDAILDGAYEVYEDFGPARRVPRRDRLRQQYPHLTEEEMDTVMNEMKEISKTVWSIAGLGGEAKVGKNKIVALLQERHAYLKAGGLIRAAFMVNYLATHEGYDR